MLVLSREPGERIIIRHAAGSLILTLTFIENRGSQAKLGFEAAPDIVILREELEYRARNEGDDRP